MRRVTRALLVTAAASFLICETAGIACADDDSPPAPESRTWEISLVDNSHADSWLEVDRTLNSEIGDGTAGSDHDGSEVRGMAPAPAASTGGTGTCSGPDPEN